MAVNSSKATLGHLYRRVNADLGTPISAAQMVIGNEAPNYETFEFIEAVNSILRELAGETEMLHRLYILRSDVGMMRYVKYTREEGTGGILRIDLDGQTATLPGGAADVECLGVQYEKICTGEGVDLSYTGVSATGTAPDSFPKIYLPAEADIDPTVYNPTSPMARLRGAGGLENQPALSTVMDIKMVGFNETGATADDEDSYFIDPYYMAAMRTITWNVGTDNGIPRSADAYLNDTWTTILGLTGASIAAGGGVFLMDGITWTVTPGLPFAGGPHTINITDGVQTWTYVMQQNETPWHVVSNHATMWTKMFAAGQDHAWYLKLDDQRIKLPDDVEKIEWVWKIPKASWSELVDEDATVPNTLTAIGDGDWFLYNPMDLKNHYFPLTESLWSSVKWSQTMGWLNRTYAGFYIQHGQQLRIEPKHTDPIAILAQCRSDLAATTTTIDKFDTIYLEVPALAVDCICYRMIADYFISLRSGSSDRSDRWEAKYQRAKSDLKKLYVAKQGQQADSPSLRLRMESGRHRNSFGYSMLPAPLRRWDQK